MKQALLNKYRDEVLRILDKHADRPQLLFGVGEFREDEHLSGELFVKIRLAEDDIHTVINSLEAYKFIETDTKDKANYYDLGKKESINSAVYAIRLTDAGKYFVKTSSFTREARRTKINRWIPNISNIVSLSAVLISVMACVICFVETRNTREEISKQKKEMMRTINVSNSKMLYHMDSMLRYELPR